MRVQLFPKMDSSPKASGGRLSITYNGMVPPSFDPPGSLLVPVQCLPCPKEGKYVNSSSFTQMEFSPSVPAHGCPKTGRKPGSLPYFCCYSCFEVQTGG